MLPRLSDLSLLAFLLGSQAVARHGRSLKVDAQRASSLMTDGWDVLGSAAGAISFSYFLKEKRIKP